MVYFRIQNNKKLNLVGGFLLHLYDTIDSNNFNDSINIIDDESTTWYSQLVHKYRTTFETKSNKRKHVIHDGNISLPPLPIGGHHLTKDRLKKNKEHRRIQHNVLHKLATNKQMKLACSFCGLHGHTWPNCTRKSQLGSEYEGKSLVKYVLENAPYSFLNSSQINNIISKMEWRGIRHITLHKFSTFCSVGNLLW